MSPLRAERIWNVAAPDSTASATLQRELGIETLIADTLVSRGIVDPEQADRFLNPRLEDLHPPELLPDYRAAVDAILAARDRKELVFLHGDYDVDGVTSTALFYRFLTRIGCNVHPHVPHRMTEGYGIHVDRVAAASQMGAKLFLTCDCGASALEQIGQARDAGMTVVVTDHHLIGSEAPYAHAFVNAHRADSNYPFKHLCGVGVVFKLCQGIAHELGHPIENFQRAYLDLATLGTIADIMPLVDENRILVRHGLPLLSQTKKPGLQELFKAASLTEKAAAGLDSFNVSFGIGPRLNAAGRIDDSSKALRLLLAETNEAARPIAQELELLNSERKEKQSKIVEQAIQMIEATGQENAPIIIVKSDDWHHGIIGIVAGKVKETYYRPAFVFSRSEDGLEYKGSGRSIEGFHLADVIAAHPELVKGGGHAKAAGLSVPVDRFDEMVESFTEYASTRIRPETLVPVESAAATIRIEHVNERTLDQIQKLKPFGEANPVPRFVALDVELRSVNQTRNPDHPQVFFGCEGRADQRFAAFNMGRRLFGLETPCRVDALFEVDRDEYRGRVSAGFRLCDLRPAGEPHSDD